MDDILHYIARSIELGALLFITYAIISNTMHYFRNKKLRSQGTEVVGEIIEIKSKPGEKSGFINVEISCRYMNVKSHRYYNGKGRAIIDVTKVADYQPGKKVRLIYNEEQPEKIFLLIKNPLLNNVI